MTAAAAAAAMFMTNVVYLLLRQSSGLRTCLAPFWSEGPGLHAVARKLSPFAAPRCSRKRAFVVVICDCHSLP